MTTIATDGITIAADGRQCSGSEVITDAGQKIFVRHGHIFAIAGGQAAAECAIGWVLSGAVPDNAPKGGDHGWQLIVIEPSRRMVRYTNQCPYPDEFYYPQSFAAGADFARAAMLCGRTPEQAIQLIIDHKLETGTGGKITVVNIDEALASSREFQLAVAAE